MVILLLPVPLVLLDTQMGLGVDEINGGFKGPVIVVGCIGFLNLPVLERYIPHQLEDTADFDAVLLDLLKGYVTLGPVLGEGV